jgi:hypothetical protein
VSKVNSQTLPKDTLLIIIIKLSFSYTFLPLGRYLRISLSPRRERVRVRGRK